MDFYRLPVWVTDPAHSCFIQCLLKSNTVLSFLERRSDITMLLLWWWSACKSYLTLCNPMDWSTLGSPVLHYLPEFVHTLVHWVSDAIQLSHPLSPPSPPTSNESALHIQWPKCWSFSFSFSPSSEFSGLISFRIDWLVWFPCSPRDSHVFSRTTVLKCQFFSDQPSLWSNSHLCTWLLEKP